MAKSILISSFILFCAVLTEASVLANISFLYSMPDLVLICTVYFALLNGRGAGQTTGFISGLLLDFITGIPFGFNCLLRTIIGYIYGFFTETLILSGFIIPMATIGSATIIKSILISILKLLFPNVNLYHPGLISNQFLFELIANIILAPVMFKFLSFFNRSLEISTTQDRVDNV